MTGPELFALAHGRRCTGPHRCLFCGAPAAAPYALPDSFTARDTLRCPGSPFACAGCSLCLEESGDARYPDGTTRHFTKAFRRMCSWVVTATTAVAATKAHLDYLRGVCAGPPAPPFLVSLAVSGQKHLLYRGVVNHTTAAAAVTLEGERIDYRPGELRDRLALCGRLCAATGKPALAGPPTPSFWFRVCEAFAAGDRLCETWSRVREEPLSRLAAFLCPPKEACQREYPGDRHDRVPPPGGGTHRPEPQAHRGRGRAKREGGGGAALPGAV